MISLQNGSDKQKHHIDGNDENCKHQTIVGTLCGAFL